MGVDAIDLAYLLECVEIEGQKPRIGLAAARDVKAPPGAVGGDGNRSRLRRRP